jgi:hypothetical protein
MYNDAYGAKFTAKRYHIYLREEKEKSKKKRRHSEWINRIIAAIFWLLKLITSSLEKVNIKKKHVIEKVLVE